jgi:hypothetical protein
MGGPWATSSPDPPGGLRAQPGLQRSWLWVPVVMLSGIPPPGERAASPVLLELSLHELEHDAVVVRMWWSALIMGSFSSLAVSPLWIDPRIGPSLEYQKDRGHVVLAIKLADVGLGAVLGAIISGAILLILDQRRRSWEKKTRFVAERRLSYTTFLRNVDLLRDDYQLIADFMLLLRDEEIHGATKISPEAGQRARRLADRLKTNLARYQELVETTATDLAFLWPLSVMRVAGEMLSALGRISEHMGTPREALGYPVNVAGDELDELNCEYDRARGGFVAEVRRDLDVTSTEVRRSRVSQARNSLRRYRARRPA